MEQSRHVKICDFGFAVDKHKGKGAFFENETTVLLAPELRFDSRIEEVTSKADMFNFAFEAMKIIKWMDPVPLEGAPNYVESNLPHLVREQKLRPKIDTNDEATFKTFIEVLKNCWNVNPSKRPSAKEIFDNNDIWKLLFATPVLNQGKSHISF